MYFVMLQFLFKKKMFFCLLLVWCVLFLRYFQYFICDFGNCNIIWLVCYWSLGKRRAEDKSKILQKFIFLQQRLQEKLSLYKE